MVVLLLIFATVSVSSGEGTTPELTNLSLNQVIELVMKNNSQVELAALGVEKADLT